MTHNEIENQDSSKISKFESYKDKLKSIIYYLPISLICTTFAFIFGKIIESYNFYNIIFFAFFIPFLLSSIVRITQRTKNIIKYIRKIKYGNKILRILNHLSINYVFILIFFVCSLISFYNTPIWLISSNNIIKKYHVIFNNYMEGKDFQQFLIEVDELLQFTKTRVGENSVDYFALLSTKCSAIINSDIFYEQKINNDFLNNDLPELQRLADRIYKNKDILYTTYLNTMALYYYNIGDYKNSRQSSEDILNFIELISGFNLLKEFEELNDDEEKFSFLIEKYSSFLKLYGSRINEKEFKLYFSTSLSYLYILKSTKEIMDNEALNFGLSPDIYFAIEFMNYYSRIFNNTEIYYNSLECYKLLMLISLEANNMDTFEYYFFALVSSIMYQSPENIKPEILITLYSVVDYINADNATNSIMLEHKIKQSGILITPEIKSMLTLDEESIFYMYSEPKGYFDIKNFREVILAAIKKSTLYWYNESISENTVIDSFYSYKRDNNFVYTEPNGTNIYKYLEYENNLTFYYISSNNLPGAKMKIDDCEKFISNLNPFDRRVKIQRLKLLHNQYSYYKLVGQNVEAENAYCEIGILYLELFKRSLPTNYFYYY